MMNGRIIVLTLLATLLLAGVVSADTTYAEGTRGLTFNGPNGVLVDIGLTGNAVVYYNFLSIAFLFVIAAMSSDRNKGMFALLVPIFAAMFVYFGWMQSSNPAATWGIILVAGILGVLLYMKGKLHENFGIAGPGEMLLNIVFYLLIFQATVGFVNGLDLFPDGNLAPDSQAYKNVDLQPQVDSINNAGGGNNFITGDAMVFVDIALSSLRIILGIIVAVVYFKATLLGAIPFLASVPAVDLLLNIMQLGIWLLYAMVIFRWFFKPSPGSSEF